MKIRFHGKSGLKGQYAKGESVGAELKPAGGELPDTLTRIDEKHEKPKSPHKLKSR